MANKAVFGIGETKNEVCFLGGYRSEKSKNPQVTAL
jgi:hypothetical protein